MRTITTNTDVYTFRELPPEAQKAAIASFKEDPNYLDWPWHDNVFKNFIENTLAPQGWDTDVSNLYFSGFWSQGDGACFDGLLNVQKYLEYHKLTEKFPIMYKAACNGPLVWADIYKNGYATHYCHEKTRYAELTIDSEDAFVSENICSEADLVLMREEANLLEKYIEDSRHDDAATLYRTLEKTYDDLLSDDSITDTIIANDYEFTLDGKLY